MKKVVRIREGRRGYSELEDRDNNNAAQRSNSGAETQKQEHISFADRVQGVLYGIVSGIICTPVSLSFAAIIFRDPAFHPYLGPLSKLVLVSSVVHQCCFSLWSSMPFAVGQVQDAGLIFLSAMASAVAARARAEGRPDAALLATACALLPAGTALLGLALVLIGRARLASLVHYLPMPVIGGYLAYIGFFCGEAGLALMAGVEVAGPQDWGRLANARALALMAPGIAGGIGILFLARRIRHMLTLPLSMFGIVLVFYLVMFATGNSVSSMRDYGWFSAETASVPALDAWEYLDFSLVHWQSALPLVPLWVAMVVVVAFSSSLDVAAIEMEARRPFDYNKELQTVGLSNFVSGLAGGFTGSYIFSQTLFNLRMGVGSRLAGAAVAAVELIVVLLPVSPLAYVPKCFFGSLLVMIATDLMSEWLIMGRSKMSGHEYTVALLTFVAIQIFGVETGLGVGVLGAMVAFVAVYAQVPHVRWAGRQRSSVLRTFEAQSLLADHAGKHAVVHLEGYVFFGSAVAMLREVKARLAPPPPPPGRAAAAGAAAPPPWREGGGGDAGGGGGGVPPQAAARLRHRVVSTEYHHRLTGPYGGYSGAPLRPFDAAAAVAEAAAAPLGPGAPPASGGGAGGASSPRGRGEGKKQGDIESPLFDGKDHSLDDSLPPVHTRESPQVHHYLSRWAAADRPPSAPDAHGRPLPPSSVGGAAAAHRGGGGGGPPVLEWLVLDLARVSGIDTTAARVCFLMLKQTLMSQGIELVFSDVRPDILKLLEIHRVVMEDDKVFPSVDKALETIEESILEMEHSAAGSYARQSSSDSYLHRSDALRRKFQSQAFELSQLGVSRDDDQAGPRTDYASCLRNECAGLHLSSILKDYLQIDKYDDQTLFKKSLASLLDNTSLEKFFESEIVGAGYVITEAHGTANAIRFISHGLVELQLPPMDGGGGGGGGAAAPSTTTQQRQRPRHRRRIQKISAGGVFGEIGFFLKVPQHFRAVALSQTHIWKLTRENFAQMQRAEPQLCILVQNALLKSLCLQGTVTLSLGPQQHPESGAGGLLPVGGGR